MTALSADSVLVTRDEGFPSSAVPRYIYLPMAASSKLYLGSMAMLDLSVGGVKAVATTLCGHQNVVGICRGYVAKGSSAVVKATADNSSGALGDLLAEIETGIFLLTNDSTTALAATHIGGPTFAVDDATVSGDSLNHNRAVAGRFLGLDIISSRPMVAIYPGAYHLCTYSRQLTATDFSSLIDTIVKISNSSGAGRVAAQAAATSPAFGVLVNAPNGSGTVAEAIVVTSGPAPLVAGAAGWTAGDQIKATTAGAGVTGATTNYVVGIGLETATSGQTKMIWVGNGGQYFV